MSADNSTDQDEVEIKPAPAGFAKRLCTPPAVGRSQRHWNQVDGPRRVHEAPAYPDQYFDVED